MRCNSNGCSLEDYPIEKFNWMNTNYLHGYKCSYYKVSLIAENRNSQLFYEFNAMFLNSNVN